MNIKGHLVDMLAMVAEALGDELRDRLVFVGGCTTVLFITDAVTIEDVRTTDDVDLIVDLVGYPEWAQLQETLRARGFLESQEDGVICRMRLRGMKVDFMPDNADILGFSNRWYRMGIESAEICELSDGIKIRILAPPLFLATKFEAYLGRGNGDLVMSKDMEDILLVVDGRPSLVEEVRAADHDVRMFIAEQFASLLQADDFDHYLQGNLRGPPGRDEIVLARMTALSESAD